MLTILPARIFRCTWSYRSIPAIGDNTQYSIVDLFVEAVDRKAPPPIAGASKHLYCDEYPKLCNLFDAIILSESDEADFAVPVTILLPSFDGYFVQENIIQDRFVDSEIVSTVHPFASWDEETRAAPPEVLASNELERLVDFGAAALIGHKTQPSSTMQQSRDIENELNCRLQLQWWQPELTPVRRLALILPGANWRLYGPIYNTAKANRIELVIVDEPDHWLNEPSNSKLREHFLPLSLDKSDGQFTNRLVELIRNCGLAVDGLIAWNDHYIIHVAEAAEILGLPTQPASAYTLCRDKHESHRLRTGGLLSALVKTEEEALALMRDPTLQFPLVVKPQFGSRSEGVTKITEASQMLPAVTKILSELDDLAVVESYLSGPEIDANLVIANGQLLFCEVADNLPCAGDDALADASDGPPGPGTFAEMGATSPSGLSQDELSMARTAAFETVIAAGFRSGVFHVEGRVLNSKMRYQQVEGKVDLRPNPKPSHHEAKFGLIEINARPPGLALSTATKRNFGVNFHEHWMLAALQDHKKMRALARPFAFPGLQGAQYWSQVLFPLVVHGGVYDGNAWTTMVSSHPKAFEHMSLYDSMWVDGDVMPDPLTGRARALASFIMYARESRPRLMEIVEDVQRQLQPFLGAGLIRVG